MEDKLRDRDTARDRRREVDRNRLRPRDRDRDGDGIPVSRRERYAEANAVKAAAGLVNEFRRIRPVVYKARDRAPPGARRDTLRPRSKSMKTIFIVGVASESEIRHFI